MFFGGSGFFQGAAFIVELSEVKASGGLVGYHDVPLQIICFDFLHVGKHFLGRVRLCVESCDYVLYLFLIFFFGFCEFVFEESKNPIHFSKLSIYK